MSLRRWTFPVALEPTSEDPLFLQIVRAITSDIRRGRLRPGGSLPGSRTLASDLGVHRNTVLAAYDALLAEGWITAESARGMFVAQELPGSSLPRVSPSLALHPAYPVAPPFSYDHAPAYARDRLVLSKGAPDVRLLPTRDLARAYRRVLFRHGSRLLMYGDARGHIRLRHAIAAMLTSSRGIPATPDRILVTRGSQMALDLVARALFSPGDRVVVEALGHPGIWRALRLAGACLVPAPLDDAGLQVEALPALAAGGKLRAIYLTPHHQFPTTTVMPPARRQALLAFAAAHGIAVIEDDYDHEFHYDGPPVLPLASADDRGTVVYVSTLSKILAPGLRVGFVVAPSTVIERLASVRATMDLQGDQATECAVAELFEDGTIGRHVRRMRKLYRSRRDTLLEALEANLRGVVEVCPPAGGMAVWARIAPDIDVDRWATEGLEHGVVFRGGRVYDFHEREPGAARLGFSCHNEAEIREAVARMTGALAASRRSMLSSSPRMSAAGMAYSVR